MKSRICILTLLFLFFSFYKADSQNTNEDLIERFLKERERMEKSFQSYVDSIYLKFAEHIASSWELFKVEPPLVRTAKPKPEEMPVFVPDDSTTAGTTVISETPVDTVMIETTPVDTVKTEPAIRKDDMQSMNGEIEKTSAINFFGTPVTFIPFKGYETKLDGINEKQVSDYLSKLVKNDHSAFIDDLNKKKTSMGLGHWGFYQLLIAWADFQFHKQQNNEKIIALVYLMTKAGYKVKIGRANNQLVVLMAFRHTIYDKSYQQDGADRYYVLTEQPPDSVASYKVKYLPVTVAVDLKTQTIPSFEKTVCTVNRLFNNKVYKFQCNNNLIDFYNSFPQTDLDAYTGTPFSSLARESIVSELADDLHNKNVAEKLKFLFAFVQRGFEYKTDKEQFGHERFCFAEETLFYPYSDCEDRAIFFCLLIKLLCNMDTLLIDYPTHVAAAVKSNEPGDAIIYKNERYIVCDPSYLKAPIGTTMKGCDNSKAKIIVVR